MSGLARRRSSSRWARLAASALASVVVTTMICGCAVGVELAAPAGSRAAPSPDDVGETADDRLLVAGRGSDEAALAATVRRALLYNPYVDAEGVEILVEGDVVILTGTVETHFERQQAEVAASTVRGVREVVNRLTVEGEGQGSRPRSPR